MKERWKEMLEYQQKVQTMTDLERAWRVMGIDEPPPKINLYREMYERAQEFADALAAARREGAEEATLRAENAEATAYAWADADAYRRGAEEMRERAARALDEDAPWAAAAIRALPLTPEEPT